MKDLSLLAGMCETRTFVINHVANNQKAAFGVEPETGESVYIQASIIKAEEIEEGDVCRILIVRNNNPQRRDDTPWKAVKVLEKQSIYDIEDLRGAAGPMYEDPEPSIEERLVSLFEENPHNFFTSREVCSEVLNEEGVNNDVRDTLVRLHNAGRISMMTIKTKGTNKKGFVYWGLNRGSFVEIAEEDVIEEAIG